MNKNRVCLADGYVFPTEQEITGINENRIVVGPTRGGKTFSIVEPLLLHTYEGSLVVTITKRVLFDKYAKLFESRGYEVLDLNFAEANNSKVGYDPIKNLKNDRDVAYLSRVLSENVANELMDKFWPESTANALSGLIGLVVANAKNSGKKASFSDLMKLFSVLEFEQNKALGTTNIDYLFKEANRFYPGNAFSHKWKTLSNSSPKTAASILAMLHIAMDDFLEPDLQSMMNLDNQISFENLSTKKTVLFVTTSPVDRSVKKLVDVFYADLFKSLFEFAESFPSKELPLPVHVVCDDFATGGRIPDFAEYISIFCAKKISATLLLQSESQLRGMYGEADATTIINNCDTYVYLGGMDNVTCQNISRRLNKPVEDIYSLPLEQVIVFRRGSKPIVGRRYQTLDDPEYKNVAELEKIILEEPDCDIALDNE